MTSRGVRMGRHAFSVCWLKAEAARSASCEARREEERRVSGRVRGRDAWGCAPGNGRAEAAHCQAGET